MTDPPSDLKKCPFCAEDIKAEAIVCRYCGRDLSPVASRSQVQVPEKKTNSSLGTCLVTAILLIVLFAIIWSIARGPSKQTNTPSQQTYSATLNCIECEEAGMDINLWRSPDRTAVIARAPHGASVTVIDSQQGSDGRTYLKVRLASTGAEGWVSEPFVKR